MRRAGKFLSVLLSLAMCLGMLQLTALAEEAGGSEDEAAGSAQENHGGTTTVTVDTTGPEGGTTVTVTAPGSETGTAIDVGHTVEHGEPGPAGIGGGTMATDTWSGGEEEDGIGVAVEGSETVTTYPGTSGGDGHPGTAIRTEGSETITVTMPEETVETDPEVVEADWNQEPGADPEGWQDETPGEPGAPNPCDVPLDTGGPLEVQLTGNADGNFSGTAGALDWDAFRAQLERECGLDEGTLSGLGREGGAFENDRIGISVSGDGMTVTITEIDEEDVQILELPDLGEAVPADPEGGGFIPPEGFEAVYGADGSLTYQKTETSADGTRISTTILTVTRSEKTGRAEVSQRRTITTTHIDLSGTDLTLTGAIGQLCPMPGDTPGEDTDTADGLSLADLIARSGVAELTEEDVKDVIAAMEAGSPGGLEGNARAFYDYMTAVDTPAADMQPVVTEASVTLTAGDGGESAYTAEVTFTVEIAPGATGDLLVSVDTEEGSQPLRVRLDLVGSGSDRCTVTPNENGTFTITIRGVSLSSDSAPVNLVIIATEELLTRRTIVEVTAGVPGGPPPDPVQWDSGSGAYVGSTDQNLQVNDRFGTYIDSQGIAHTVSYSFEAGENGEADEEKGNSGGITVSYQSGDQYATITGPADRDVYVEYIAVKAARGTVIYQVPGGVLRAGQVITVQSVTGQNPNGQEILHAISHVCLIGVTGSKPVTGTAYTLSETTTTQRAGATLSLRLTGGTAVRRETEAGQVRYGSATVTQSALTIQERIITELNWSGMEFIRDDDRPAGDPTPPGGDPTPPPPGGGRTTGGGGRTASPARAGRTASTAPAAAPAWDIADEAVPLAELPETPVPLAEGPEELEDIPETSVPLADVPETGDGSGLWYTAALVSLCGLTALSLKKREDGEA